jgi:hypothetical protein
MAINFTDSPSDGDTITADGRTYTYNSSAAKWKITASSNGTGSPMAISDTAPGSPSNGDLWFDTTELVPYIYYADGTSSQWVEFYPASGSSGGGGGTLTAAASGALANGDMVIINSDGTVSAVGQTTTSPSVGSATTFNSNSTTFCAATFDSNANKVVVAYVNNANAATAIVGTVSGTSISFGTPTVFNNSATDNVTITFDSNANKVVIGYRDSGNSNYGTAIVGTVSGTSISFGSEVVFNSASTLELASTFDSNANKVVFAYRDGGNSNYGTAIVGTVSGTSISFGSETVYYSGINLETALCFDSTSNNIIVAYRAHTHSQTRCRVGTISGTTISFPSTHTTFNGNNDIDFTQLVYDSSNDKVVLMYWDEGNSYYGTAIVGTVSGTSISFGSEVVFNSSSTSYLQAHFDSNSNKIIIGYRDGGNSSYPAAIAGTVSGTSISFGTALQLDTVNAIYLGGVFDSNQGRSVFAYYDATNSGVGKAVAALAASASSTNLTASNYIGVSDAAYSNSATATIQVVGSVDDAQSGLTAGQSYYVQTDGSLSTTAGSPSVFAGTAVSASKLIIKG